MGSFTFGKHSPFSQNKLRSYFCVSYKKTDSHDICIWSVTFQGKQHVLKSALFGSIYTCPSAALQCQWAARSQHSGSNNVIFTFQLLCANIFVQETCYTLIWMSTEVVLGTKFASQHWPMACPGTIDVKYGNTLGRQYNHTSTVDDYHSMYSLHCHNCWTFLFRFSVYQNVFTIHLMWSLFDFDMASVKKCLWARFPSHNSAPRMFISCNG